jgi:hypothetical protein
MWNIWQGFEKLPWEWNQEEPNTKDMIAMVEMAGWSQDRERMDQEKAHQKSAKSSNIKGMTYKID